MYLDTDIILGLIKDEDWLKQYVAPARFKLAKTSTITIIEARLVLGREYSRKEAIDALGKIKKLKIKIMPLDITVIEKSQELLAAYPTLGIFDSIHAATAMNLNEQIISTDTIFTRIDGLRKIDPRDLAD